MTSQCPKEKLGYAFAKEKLLRGESASENEIRARFIFGKHDRSIPRKVLERLHSHYKNHTELLIEDGELILKPTSSKMISRYAHQILARKSIPDKVVE